MVTSRSTISRSYAIMSRDTRRTSAPSVFVGNRERPRRRLPRHQRLQGRAGLALQPSSALRSPRAPCQGARSDQNQLRCALQHPSRWLHPPRANHLRQRTQQPSRTRRLIPPQAPPTLLTSRTSMMHCTRWKCLTSGSATKKQTSSRPRLTSRTNRWTLSSLRLYG